MSRARASSAAALMPPSAPGRLTAAARKEQIVETVLALVQTHGTGAVSAQRVANAVGITQPAVFRHFRTKESLWLAVMDWLEERVLAIYRNAGEDAGQSPVTAIARMFLG